MFSGGDVVERLVAVGSLLMPENPALLAHRTFQAFHRCDGEFIGVDTVLLKDLEALPNAFNGCGDGALTKRDGDIAMGIKRRKFLPGERGFGGDVDDYGVWVAAF